MVTLLILLNICHWLADYTWLSTSWMLNAKRYGRPLVPILTHAAVHSVLMAICVGFYTNSFKLSLLAFSIQLVSHFVIDVWKGKMNVWFPIVQSPTNKLHWVLFGLDQLLHQIIIIYICKIITT
jgi:hypothetical protein